jgi:UDP-glucose 4-epimerase
VSEFRRVLITGGLGFVGSNLMDSLVAQGKEVHVIDNLSTGKQDYLNPGIYSYSYTSVGSQPFPDVDLIVHLAALARIQPSFKEPVKTYENNSTVTVFALEEARRLGVPLIYAGSSSCFHDVFANPYTYSKWLGEQHCTLYRRIYGVKAAVARFFNVFGPRQIDVGPYATVVGIFERQYAAGDLLTITGTGEQRRDFTHVSDVVGGIEAIMRSDFSEEKPYQLGTGENHSINEVADMFPGASRIYVATRPGEAWSTNAEAAETQKRLGWRPSRRLHDYLRSRLRGG